MTEDPIMPSELGAYTNNLQNKEAIKKLCDIVNNIEISTDVYTKEETNGLLAEKQNVLTPGTGISISENVISVNTKSWVLKSGDWSNYLTYDSEHYAVIPSVNCILKVKTYSGDSIVELHKGIPVSSEICWFLRRGRYTSTGESFSLYYIDIRYVIPAQDDVEITTTGSTRLKGIVSYYGGNHRTEYDSIDCGTTNNTDTIIKKSVEYFDKQSFKAYVLLYVEE